MITFWKKKDIHLGDQLVSELTILEWKKLFSLKLFHFHPSTDCQDRFHTHAFKAFSLLLSGNYIEEVVEGRTIVQKPRNRSRLLYIPANQFHRITRSSGCKTLLLTGPWGPCFKELTHIEGNRYKGTLCGAGRGVLAYDHLETILEKSND